MVSRSHRARSLSQAEHIGGPQLTLAHLIVTIENIVRIFARPLMLAGAFVTLSWLGVLPSLYPWAHLVVLTLFLLFFIEAFAKARLYWQPVPASAAKRRVEEASSLTHRPLDVLEDRPVTLDSDQLLLWQMHVERAKEQVKKLHWPRWKLNFEGRDPYALRYGLLILLVIAAVSGWGALGGRLIAAINPAIGKLQLLSPTLDAWITPPEYTHLPPIMIATPAGARHDGDVLDVPEGSKISAHLAERDGDAPVLVANGEKTDFTVDDHGDFEAAQALHSGDQISIHRGWQKLGSWHIRIVPDQAPQITMTETPSVTERKAVRLSYEATDDYGITSVTARITPRESLPGASNQPLEIPLAAPDVKQLKRANFEDLTAHPWAGLPVQVQLIATDAVGHQSFSDTADFTLPERIFFQPVARALIDERKKLLQAPEDEGVRNEVANVMAGIAHQPTNYRGDPVVLMALRSGAVRLVLDHDADTVPPVNDLLWQAAVRIEDGTVGLAEQNLRQAQKDLADALDRNAGEQDIQRLIDRLHQALAQYLSELSTRMAARPGPVEDLSQMMGSQTNMLTPNDLDRMLERMRTLSASGSREAAREELSKLQQLLESMRTDRPQLTEEQKQAMRQLAALRGLVHQQQQLLDKTFQSAQAHAKDAHKLATEQSGLLQKLQELIGGLKSDEGQNLNRGAGAMKQADSALQQDEEQKAVPHQNEALQAMQQTVQQMADSLRSSMMMLPMPGMGEFGQGSDPFGRNPGGMFSDDSSVKVPDRMEVRRVREILDELQRRAGDMNRPKVERDYIERLLQNF